MYNDRLMIRKSHLLNGFVVFFALGCSSYNVPTTTSGGYSEDLSVWHVGPDSSYSEIRRPNPDNTHEIDRTKYVAARYAVNDNLHAVLDSIDRINLSARFVDGYSIQIYTGNSREEALDAKRTFALQITDITADLRYVQPNYRVRCGQYYTRLEAHKDYMVIRRYFPAAIIIPEKLPIP